MAEAFHQWVNNMPWWEKLYYQLFDPQAITCSTYPTVPGIYFVGPTIILFVASVIILWRAYKNQINSDKKTEVSIK